MSSNDVAKIRLVGELAEHARPGAIVTVQGGGRDGAEYELLDHEGDGVWVVIPAHEVGTQ